MSQPIKGPYTVQHESIGGYAITSKEVGESYYSHFAVVSSRYRHPVHGGEISPTTARATAVLMAAAPEMLKLLIGVRSLVAREAGSRANGELGEPYLKQLLADLDETIKKATE